MGWVDKLKALGISDTLVAPQKTITRAEMMAVLERLSKVIDN